MAALVLDCSVAIAWLFEDEATAALDGLLDRVGREGALVPGLWPLKLGNVLVQAERRGRIARGDIAARLGLIERLPIRIDERTAASALHDTLALALGERLTTYDAAYLELAMRSGLPLASQDRDLLKAAERMRVPTLP